MKKPPMERMTCACGDHVWAPASRGYAILVSPDDEAILDDFWGISTSLKNSTYVCATRNVSSERLRQVSIKMHRELMKPPAGMCVDHRNLNSLDNRRPNLRICTPQQNLLNRRPYAGKAVPLKGVQRIKATGKYKAVIRFNKVLHQLGQSFETPEQAHEAYLAKARELHGEFFRAA